MSAFFLYSKYSPPVSLLTLLEISYGSILPKDKKDMVIQWGNGNLSSQDPDVHVLNGEEGLVNVANRKTMMDILKWNGIPAVNHSQQPKISTIRRYFVSVFQQQELALYRSRGRKIWLTNEVSANSSDTYEEIEMNSGSKEIRKVLRYAVRSIYSLGLDFGGVLIGIALNGTMNVIDVTPTPKLNHSLAEKFRKAIEQYVEQYSSISEHSVMLGADPEFVLRNKTTGKMVLASRFFGKKGSVGCDHIWLRSDQTRRQLPLAELRPQPAKEPRQLVINLYKTMMLAEKKINLPSIEWLAGGMPFKGYPIGGHIHFSQTKVNSAFLRALDSYLGLPLMLIENDLSLSRRPKYGFLGDFRNQFHGGFEYRTLPSWLISPRVTKGVLALAKLIAESYPKLREVPTLQSSIQSSFYHGEKRKLTPVVKTIWTHLENLEDYSKYSNYIEPLKQLIFNADEWNEFQDIREAWRIPPYSVKKSTSDMI